jgi:hypothetical protein
MGMVRFAEHVFIGLFAQQPDEHFAERYDAAVAHLEQGRASGSRESYQRCADGFVELYNEYEEYARADELLFNAAVCSEFAGAIGMAIALRAALLEHHPQSNLAEPTLAGLAFWYAAIAHYDDAAERYEQYAARYPHSKDTPDALQNAYLFRLGLDQTDAALENLDDYEQLYEREDPDKAAQIFWSRRELLDSARERREHAVAYIERHGKAVSVDRWLVAEAVVAQIDWRSSCSEPLLFDSCITIERRGRRPRVPGMSASMRADVARMRAQRPGKKPERCGGPGYAIVTVHAREQELAKQAQARFDRILSALGKSGPIQIPEHEPWRRASFLDAWAMALVYRADAKYEKFLRRDLPADLKPDRTQRRYEQAIVRLGTFTTKKEDLGEELADQYAAVDAVASPHWQLVAAARVGMLYESFADQLEHAKVPGGLVDRAQLEDYCGLLGAWAQPLRQHAIEAWGRCIERSTQLELFGEFSRLCELRLADLDPRHPATHELFGEPGPGPTRMRTVGVLPDE